MAATASDLEEERYRPAGVYEHYHIARQHLHFDTCVVVAAQFVRTWSDGDDVVKSIPPAAIYRALAHAICTHAALSASIGGADTRAPYFTRLPVVDVVHAVRFLDREKTLEALIEAQLADPIDDAPGKPLWRLTVAPRRVLLFAWHHAIGDGQSGLAVLRTLLCALNSDVDGDSDSDDPEATSAELETLRAVRPPADLRLTPPADSLLPIGPTFLSVLSTLASLILPRSLTHRGVWTGNPTPAPSATNEYPRVTARLILLPPPHTARVLAAARAHSATLTGALHALALSALAPLLPSAYTRVAAQTPTSLRPRANPPVSASAMCDLVAAYASFAPLPVSPSPSSSSSSSADSDFPWPIATSFTRALHRAAPHAHTSLGALRLLRGAHADYLRGSLGSPRAVSFEISNPGAFRVNSACACSESGTGSGSDNNKNKVRDANPTPTPTPQRPGRWRITTVSFAQNDGFLGAALKLNVVGGGDGSVSVCITWHAHALDDALAEAFVARFKEGLQNMSEPGHDS